MRNLIFALLLLAMFPIGVNAEDAAFVASPERKRVVVIDPGHGGPRPGKVMRDVVEADYVLDVSKEVRRQLGEKMSDLEVYLTRSSDSAYHENQAADNRKRAEFANKKGADLYVSIHANAHKKTTVTGCEVWVLTLNDKLMSQNQDKAASYADDGDFINLEDIDRTSQGFMMAVARQLDNEPFSCYFAELCCENISEYGLANLGVKAGPVFTVLYYFEGPGVIVELGYLTNTNDYDYLTSKGAKKEMATAISDAIVCYFKALDGIADEEPAVEAAEESAGVAVSHSVTVNAVEADAVADAEPLTEGYTIQLISSTVEVPTDDYQFKGYKGRVAQYMGTGRYKYKYCYGSYASAEQAKEDLAEARKTFKDAYVVRFKDGNIVTK
uniref:N-acetylmuramoyl-L-alanine amidase family protein n=1 Tax=Alistipes sp. TaxID=1872444 RepID=UPI004055F463